MTNNLNMQMEILLLIGRERDKYLTNIRQISDKKGLLATMSCFERAKKLNIIDTQSSMRYAQKRQERTIFYFLYVSYVLAADAGDATGYRIGDRIGKKLPMMHSGISKISRLMVKHAMQGTRRPSVQTSVLRTMTDCWELS